MRNFLWNSIAIFCAIFILTFEFDYSIIPIIHDLINPLFEELVSFTGTYFFALESGFSTSISSDSSGLFIHVFNLGVISLFVAGIIEFIWIKKIELRSFLVYMLTYYLALQLLIYGFDKIFKAQFFLPEPNTLFTPLKDISKDLLYWSTVGVSRSYSMFLGFTEIITALLLLFKKTRLIAIILGIGVMINVVSINFSYDISVKLYSLFLLSGFAIIGSSYFYYLYQVLVNKKWIETEEVTLFNGYNRSIKKGMKIFLMLLFLAESLYPYLKTQNFNDDSFARPIFHGAYEVLNQDSFVKNVFINRHGYLIFQNNQDEFQDFQLETDTINKQLVVFDYRTKSRSFLSYQNQDNSLTSLSGTLGAVEIKLELTNCNLENAPVLKDEFNWIVK